MAMLSLLRYPERKLSNSQSIPYLMLGYIVSVVDGT